MPRVGSDAPTYQSVTVRVERFAVRLPETLGATEALRVLAANVEDEKLIVVSEPVVERVPSGAVIGPPDIVASVRVLVDPPDAVRRWIGQRGHYRLPDDTTQVSFPILNGLTNLGGAVVDARREPRTKRGDDHASHEKLRASCEQCQQIIFAEMRAR